MNTIRIHRFIMVLGLVAISQSAFAQATITATYNGSANFGNGAVGYGNGKIWPSPNHTGLPATLESVGVGGDNFTTSDNYSFIPVNGTFNTWCVDITHWLIGGTTEYKLGGKSQLNSIFGSSRIDDVNTLANQHYAGLNDQNSSAAFQLAIWTILFGTSDVNGNYNLNSSTFKTSNGIAGGVLAQSWLNTLDTANKVSDLNIIYMYGSRPGSQNLVVFAPVPEPSTYLMMLGGIGLLGFVARRKTKQEGNLEFISGLQFA